MTSPRPPRKRPVAPVPDETLPGLIFHLVRALRLTIERELAPFDITAQQRALLNGAVHETSPSRLATLIATDSAGMTRLLDRLEDKGLISRRNDPSDRRSLVIEVTDAGRSLVDRTTPALANVNSQLLAGMSQVQTRQARTILHSLLDNLNEHLDVGRQGD